MTKTSQKARHSGGPKASGRVAVDTPLRMKLKAAHMNPAAHAPRVTAGKASSPNHAPAAANSFASP